MPGTVAIVGASMDRSKFGNKSVRAHARAGWRVYPVHPSADAIEGWPAYAKVSAVPQQPLDRVSVYLPPAVVMAVLDDIAANPPGELWLNPGADAPEVVAKARSLGLNVICSCSIVDVGCSPAEFP
jgi:predicted CoA-binding protein